MADAEEEDAWIQNVSKKTQPGKSYWVNTRSGMRRVDESRFNQIRLV